MTDWDAIKKLLMLDKQGCSGINVRIGRRWYGHNRERHTAIMAHEWGRPSWPVQGSSFGSVVILWYECMNRVSRCMKGTEESYDAFWQCKQCSQTPLSSTKLTSLPPADIILHTNAIHDVQNPPPKGRTDWKGHAVCGKTDRDRKIKQPTKKDLKKHPEWIEVEELPAGGYEVLDSICQSLAGPRKGWEGWAGTLVKLRLLSNSLPILR